MCSHHRQNETIMQEVVTMIMTAKSTCQILRSKSCQRMRGTSTLLHAKLHARLRKLVVAAAVVERRRIRTIRLRILSRLNSTPIKV